MSRRPPAPLTPRQAAQARPRPGPWTPQAGRGWRRRLSSDLESSLSALWARALAQVGLVDDGAAGHAVVPGLALAAVGSLARREAGPASDLDLVLLHDRAGPGARATGGDVATVASLAENLWYPLWDAGVSLDHSVRTVEEVREVAGRDLPAAVGMLDLRHLAGDPGLTGRCATVLLADWRRATRTRLPELATRPPGAPDALAAAQEALGQGPAALRRLARLWLLTEADARATGPRAWSAVRAQVIARATAGLARGLGADQGTGERRGPG